MAEAIKFFGGDAGFDKRCDLIQHLGGETADDAHVDNVCGSQYGNSHGECFVGCGKGAF